MICLLAVLQVMRVEIEMFRPTTADLDYPKKLQDYQEAVKAHHRSAHIASMHASCQLQLKYGSVIVTLRMSPSWRHLFSPSQYLLLWSLSYAQANFVSGLAERDRRRQCSLCGGRPFGRLGRHHAHGRWAHRSHS